MPAQRNTVTKPTVIIVEDEETYAHRVLARPFARDWRVVHAYNVPQAARAVDDLTSLQLALVDLNLPGGRPFHGDQLGGGFEIVEVVCRQFPGCRTVVVSGHFSETLVNTATSLGAGYLSKSHLDTELVALARDRPPRASQDLARHAAILLAQRHDWSSRETEVAALAIVGLSASAIAQRLGTSHHTVKTQLDSVRTKSGVANLAQLRLDARCVLCRHLPGVLP